MPKPARPLTREESKLLTRHRLLQAGFDLVLEYGHDGLTTGRIAARAGIAQPSFYAHFKDMDELLEELAESTVDKLRKALRRVRSPLRQGEPYEAATVETFRLGLDAIRRNADMLRLFMSEQHRPKSAMGRCAQHLLKELTQDMYDDLAAMPLLADVPRPRLQLISETIIGLTAQFGLSLAQRSEDNNEELAQLLAQTTLTLLLNSRESFSPAPPP